MHDPGLLRHKRHPAARSHAAASDGCRQRAARLAVQQRLPLWRQPWLGRRSAHALVAVLAGWQQLS